MEVIVEEIRFKSTALNETEPTDWPVDNIGEVVDVEIDVRYDGSYTLATTINPDDGTVLILNPNSSTTGGIIPDKRYLFTNDPTGFQQVDEGDLVTVSGTGFSTTEKTVLEKVSSRLLLMDSEYLPSNETILPVDSVAFVSTPIESIEFSHGLIENKEVFNTISKTDGSDQRAIVEGLSNTVLTESTMEQLNDKSYQHGTLSVRGNGIGDSATDPQVSQAFTISQKLLINPLFTADQADNDKVGIPPDYLESDASLKYVFKIATSKDLTDPNRKKTVISGERLGNIGGIGENFNTGRTDYYVTNVNYKRADLSVIDSLEITTDEQIVEFDLNNDKGTFSSGDTRAVFNHWWKPTPEDLYRLPEFPAATQTYPSRQRLLKENFFFDRAELILDDPAVAGDNINGVDQIIKDCSAAYISNSKIRVTTTIKMSSTAVSRISSTDDYKLSISTKDHSKSRAKSDKTNVLVDNNTYFTEASDPSMVKTTITFLDHPNSDVDAGAESLVVRTEDDVLAVASFTIDRNDIPNFTRAGTEVRLLSTTMQVIARKDYDTYFVLDEFTTALDATDEGVVNDLTYGNIPFVDFTRDLGQVTPADDLRKNIRLKRRIDLDAGGEFAFEFRMPFYYRWENFFENKNVSDEFFDISLPFNGKNHDWPRFFDGTGWDMFFRFEVNVLKDGALLAPYITEAQLITEDYGEGTEWDTPVGRTFKASNLDPISIGGGIGISLDENTLIETENNFNTTPLPTLPDLVAVLKIAIFEKSGYIGQFRFSSLYTADSNNVFTGVSGGDLAIITNPSGSLFQVAGITKSDLLKNAVEYRVSWRFHDTRDEAPPVPPAVGILEEDGTFIIEEGVSTTYGIEE